MHTTRLQVKNVGEVIIIHNGDWSGDTIVRWGFEKNMVLEAKFPADILMAVAKKSVFSKLRDKMISFLEQLDEE